MIVMMQALIVIFLCKKRNNINAFKKVNLQGGIEWV